MTRSNLCRVTRVILVPVILGLTAQLAKPGRLTVANRSHHCTVSETVRFSPLIIACNAAPARFAEFDVMILGQVYEWT
jgi:hypothetical protein